MIKQMVTDILDRGVTQMELAETIGCSQPKISLIVNGKVDMLNYQQYDKLAKVHKNVMRRK
jgi:DNA-binding Xre family transcriptional regulator